MIKTSNYKEIKQLAIKSSLRSLTHTYIELKDGNSLPSDWAEKHKSFLAPTFPRPRHYLPLGLRG